jgi:hypothetical protein
MKANQITFKLQSKFIQSIKQYGKGKAIPLQAWTGFDSCRRLRPSDFKIIST